MWRDFLLSNVCYRFPWVRNVLKTWEIQMDWSKGVAFLYVPLKEFEYFQQFSSTKAELRLPQFFKMQEKLWLTTKSCQNSKIIPMFIASTAIVAIEHSCTDATHESLVSLSPWNTCKWKKWPSLSLGINTISHQPQVFQCSWRFQVEYCFSCFWKYVLGFCSLINISLNKNCSITKHFTILVTSNAKTRCLTRWVWEHILIPSVSLSSCGRDFSRGVFFHLMCVMHCVKTLELQALHIKVSWAVTGNIQMPWLGVSGNVLSPHTIYWALICSKYSSLIYLLWMLS